MWPWWQAACSGVAPLVMARPLATSHCSCRNCTTTRLPASLAAQNGVVPVLSIHSASAPRLFKSRAARICSSRQAWKKPVWPSASTWSTSIEPSSSMRSISSRSPWRHAANQPVSTTETAAVWPLSRSILEDLSFQARESSDEPALWPSPPGASGAAGFFLASAGIAACGCAASSATGAAGWRARSSSAKSHPLRRAAAGAERGSGARELATRQHQVATVTYLVLTMSLSAQCRVQRLQTERQRP